MSALFGERVDYQGAHLLESEAPADPVELFADWLSAALQARDAGQLAEPNAMVVATIADGRPSARTVLLKQADADGFVFFTNYNSHKGAELAANPAVALTFGWYAMHRQVRVEGNATPVSREESETYFASRPRGSQLGAWASAQSSEVESLNALVASYQAAEERYGGIDVPCPPHWGGYRVVPTTIEFWQGQPSRMHDRLRYSRTAAGWQITRLAP